MFSDLLARNRPAIVQRWIRLIVDTYPPDTARFLQREGDQFLNPVGHTIAEESEALFAALLRGASSAELEPRLDNIIRVRAVQDFSAAQAVGFVFLLKTAVREAVAAANQDKPSQDELLSFESRVDNLALLAFDIYMRRRERIFEIRAKEIKGRADRILDRMNRLYGVPDEPGTDADEPGNGSSKNKRGSA